VTQDIVPVGRQIQEVLSTWQPSREAIVRLQRLLETYPQIDLPVNHRFAHGIYVRELPMPAGTICVGKTHRFSHVFFVLSGDVTILTDIGIERVQGPYTFISEGDVKRVVITHTDTVFMTIHHTNETDVEAIESEIIIPEVNLLEGVAA
jgi:hypothetical protein